MTAQTILFYAGIVLIVLAVVFAGLAVWYFFTQRIRDLMDDVSGKKRFEEISAMNSGGSNTSVRRLSRRSSGMAVGSGILNSAQTSAEAQVAQAVKYQAAQQRRQEAVQKAAPTNTGAAVSAYGEAKAQSSSSKHKTHQGEDSGETVVIAQEDPLFDETQMFDDVDFGVQEIKETEIGETTIIEDDSSATTIIEDDTSATTIIEDDSSATTIIDGTIASSASIEDGSLATNILEDDSSATTLLDDDSAATSILEDDSSATTVLEVNDDASTVFEERDVQRTPFDDAKSDVPQILDDSVLNSAKENEGALDRQDALGLGIAQGCCIVGKIVLTESTDFIKVN